MPLDPTIWNPSLVGPPGADGRTIHTVSGAPSDLIGEDYDYAIDPLAWVIYGPKVGGVWPAGSSLVGPAGTNGTNGVPGARGLKGDPGATGASGAPGSVIHSGLSAPTVDIGVDGDYFFNLTTADFYGPKTAGLWGVSVSLKGDKGDTGPKGDLVPEFRVDSGWVQWKYTIDVAWNNLITVAELTGPAGAAGIDGTNGVVAAVVAGTNISVNATDPANPVISFSPPATVPYDMGFFVSGIQPANKTIFKFTFTRDVDFSDDFAGCDLHAGAAATASFVYTVKQNGVAIGTITVAAAGTSGTFLTSSGAPTFTINDVLEIVTQVGADATLADVSITLSGARTY